ncbi:hypothetical protein AVEN_217550-1 [Araneus ventricosus]|uniref:Uncharacterized protein n=1 Tax=Araneus ventricosus TaxID=182803 RepID=A0A4Y2UP73_ARAVE|nr:hypothetical protein AVEN_217550-1 [Araneus ventricosus]
MKEDRYHSSDTEVSILTAIIDHGLNPPEGGKYWHRCEGNSSPHHNYTHVQEGEPVYLSCSFNPRYSWFPQMGERRTRLGILDVCTYIYILKEVTRLNY